MKTIRVSRGMGGIIPGSPAAFVVMVHATFDSAEAFTTAFAPHATELQGDAPNCTRRTESFLKTVDDTGFWSLSDDAPGLQGIWRSHWILEGVSRGSAETRLPVGERVLQ